jgi:hypothetical protein
MTTDTETRDDRVYRMRLLGIAPRVIAEQCGCTIADVAAAVEARLPKVTNEYRAQLMRLDLERLDQLTAFCLGQMAKGSLAAGHLLLKTLERRSHLMGFDSPLRVDAVQLVELSGPQETSTQELKRVFDEIRRERSGEPSSEPRPPSPSSLLN